MNRLYLWPVVIAALLLAPVAHACSCLGRPDCGAFQIRDTLFVGKALSVQVIETKVTGIPFPVRRRIYRFEVSQALAGAPQTSEVVEIETGMGGGDCGYGFDIGQSYLVDASPVDAGPYGENGRLSTSICTATQPEVMAHNLLREIRAILTHQRLPDLSGIVASRDSLNDSASAKPLAGITVRLTPANGNAYSAITDAEGIYTLLDLPAGEYRVEYELPPTLVTYRDAMGHPQTIKISLSGNAACHADATALPSGTISGQIVYGAGKPMSALGGIVSLRKLGEAHDEQNGAFPDATGHFTIPFVKAGEYRVVLRVYGHGPVRESWLEPSAAYPQGTVVMKEGEHVAGINIVGK